MKQLIESGKKYTLWDCVFIPLRVSPVPAVIIIILRIILALTPSLTVIFTAAFTDNVLAAAAGEVTARDVILPLTVLMLIILYNSTNNFFENILWARMTNKLSEVYRSQVINKRARLEYQHIENIDTWELISRTCADPEGQLLAGFNTVSGLCFMGVRLASLLLVVLAQVWWAALVICVISLPLFFLAVKGGNKNYDAYKDANKLSRRENYLHSILSMREGVQERSVFGFTHAINEQWHDYYEQARKMYIRVNAKYFVRMKAGSIITLLISVFMTGVLVFPLARHEISIGMFIGLVNGVFNIVQMMSWQLAGYMQDLAYRREYLKDLTTFCSLSETPGALDEPERGINFQSLEFRDVSFKYPGIDRYILRHCSFALKNGRHYAFVGANGAGKTTITKLICRMYDNYEGEILLNGRELRSYPLKEIKDCFTVVFQDYGNYCVPFRDSVMLGDVRKRDEARLKKVVEEIGLDQAVQDLPAGMDTPLGKIITDGVDLSGGQWQRVAIARSLYSSAQVRILDEPTASLDPVAESEVYNMFGRVSRNSTTIFITHRLGAARLADDIIVLEDGAVKETGSHEELLKRGGLYAEMFESQRSWYK